MKFAFSTTIIALVGAAYAQDCPEALRFGSLSVNGSTFKVGDPITITNNLTCTPIVRRIHPRFIDYYLEATNNNGYQPPIYLARTTLNVSETPVTDIIYTKIPRSQTITNFPKLTAYQIVSTLIYPILGNDGSSVLIAGGTETDITVKSS